MFSKVKGYGAHVNRHKLANGSRIYNYEFTKSCIQTFIDGSVKSK